VIEASDTGGSFFDFVICIFFFAEVGSVLFGLGLVTTFIYWYGTDVFSSFFLLYY
jgi:hypothetical protein